MSALRSWRRACAALLLAGTGLHATGGEVLQRLRESGELRVCIWPDYQGITWRDPRTGELSGIDIELSAALARDLGLRLRHVDSSFPQLAPNLLQGRCDVAMHAVGITPERARAVRFTQPYLRSDIYGITSRTHRAVREWADIDRPGVRVAVQAGTFMEPVMAAALRQAQLVVVRPPATREQELEAGRVDVFMTDYPYGRRLLQTADWTRLVAPPRPFHAVPYAYAVAPGDEAWLQEVDRFVERIRRDGRLRTAAQRHGLDAILVER